ncbi:CapA family protein [Kallipyga gabonensis]|uniref:CapA family protein n=1 Tax=Kallipyga gabonensis TaxID=1686287 RepID=UPI0006B576BD|nr:CapA family protein [Kallipyga gabonensis]
MKDSDIYRGLYRKEGKGEKTSTGTLRKLILALITFSLVFLVVFSVGPFQGGKGTVKAPAGPQEKGPIEEAHPGSENWPSGNDNALFPKQEEEKGSIIRVKATGDIMHHIEQAQRIDGDLEEAKREFALIADYLCDADLTLANFESSHDSDKPASGYPMFNTPATIFPAMKDAGFDVLSTVNNHTLDMRLTGVDQVLDLMRENGLIPVGTRKEGEKDRFIIMEVNGVKIGILAYSYGFNGIEKAYDKALLDERLNFMESDRIKEDIEACKAQGVDFIIGSIHNGIEYQTRETQAMRENYRQYAEWGMDAIIGNHPHVVGPFETYRAQDGRDCFIIYACGNFISQQRYEVFDDYRVEHGVVVDMAIEKKGRDHARLVSVDFAPLWVRLTRDDKGLNYQTLSVEDYLKNPDKKAQLSDNEVKRVEEARREVYETLYSKELPETEIKVMENPLGEK